MSKPLLRISQTFIDLSMLSLAFILAFCARFDGAPPAPMTGRLLLTAPYVIGFQYLILMAYGVHRFSWRYTGLREGSRILVACATSSAILVASRLIAGELQHDYAYFRHGAIPLGVLAVDFVLAFLGIAFVRVGRRMFAERVESRRRRPSHAQPVRTLLIGAGEAGVVVARELASRPDLALRAIGFIDDDPRKLGAIIHGLPVLGSTAELPELCAKHRAKQALITMANVPGGVVRNISRLCEAAGIPAKIVPGVYEIVGGKVNLSRIRDVAIEDLLGRDPVDLDIDQLEAFVRGKVVLTTGAGGSIGSELCRQVCRYAPSKLVLVERSENALFNIHREVCSTYPSIQVEACLADITDVARMTEVVVKHAPRLIFHAAAHKHVPIMESNVGECVKNNVFGTRIVADLAVSYGAEAFVMISTDKAVNPSSVMGATKRAAELYVQSLSGQTATRLVTVRFGNVLGSAGSVIPIFREQIAQGGPVTVTHPEMRRYFMTIPEACQLVMQAGAMGRGGEIFVLDMGEPVRIVDLARDLITLSGLRADEDIEIRFTGVRPGEKLFEELSADAEHADKTRHPKIFVGRLQPVPSQLVLEHLQRLRGAVDSSNEQQLLRALERMVPEYKRSLPSTPPDSESLPDRSSPLAVPNAVAS